MIRLALVALALLAAPGWAAGPLYKLIDGKGRVTFTDTVPKDFDGQVIRLEVVTTPTVPPTPVPPAPSASPPARVETFSGRRQQDLAALADRLEKARARVAAAQKAKDEGGRAAPQEMQVVQRRYPPPKAGQPAPFPNCATRKDPASGSPVMICPAQVPGPAFYERQRKLDDDLVAAELELADAERAYRRGVD